MEPAFATRQAPIARQERVTGEAWAAVLEPSTCLADGIPLADQLSRKIRSSRVSSIASLTIG